MRLLIAAFRVARTGLRNFFRNAWLSTAATAIMLVTLLIILSGIIINLALSKEIENITDDISISVFLLDKTSDEDRTNLQTELKALENVRGVKYISKADAVDIFSKQNEDQPEVLDGLTISENPLPASLEVKMFDLEKIDPIIGLADSEKYTQVVESTDYDEERQTRIDTIAGMQNIVTSGLAIAGGIFAGISILIIFNTIRMAIFTRGEEIRIMKLIGATNWFIRGPFLFEAALYGLIAGILTITIVYGFLLSLGDDINRYLDFGAVMTFFNEQWYLVVTVTIISGILLGVVSSTLAMARYLKL